MKPVTIYLDSCDYDLIKAISPNSVYFFQKCQVFFENTDVPFASIAVMFTPNRLTRRPLCAMLKDLICAIADNHPSKEVICALVYRFIFYLE